MFEAHGCKCDIQSVNSIHNRVMENAIHCLEVLKAEPELNCSTISLSFDGWTTKSNVPIFTIIRHWIGLDFIYQKAVIEFARLKVVHLGENIALVVYKCLQFLNIMHKLLAITSDSASNNGTLVPNLHQQLLKHSNDEFDDLFEFNIKLLMQFQGAKSHIHCLTHALNQVVRNILTKLKSRTMKEAQGNEVNVNAASLVAKLQYIVV
jgi:hypothetical protein